MQDAQAQPGFEDRTLPDRYCDLILTGGVTSAIAYPGVIFGLAQAYRFNAIGGSSSGAGSAALAAAAEFRRRHGSSEGFRTLLRRTGEVQQTIDGKARLASLFQPDKTSRRLFEGLLPAFIGPQDRGSKFLCGIAKAYAWHLVGAFVLAFAVVFCLGWWADASRWWRGAVVAGALATGLLVTLVWLAFRLWLDVKGVIRADFGLCSGHADPGAAPAPLTPWLHGVLQDVAGLPLDQPLTFADLHAAPAGPRETLGDASPAGARSIDLCMFAANVTEGRPLLLPQRDDDPPLYFRPRELRRLFPHEVLNAMTRQPGRRRQGSASQAIDPASDRPGPGGCADEEDLWELPRLDLPVLVAARMSVSFPVLFSAVPLWQADPAGGGYRRLLFVDGGLCSNFPIHLFDCPIPSWPTFGVALRDGGGPYRLDPAWIASRVTVLQDPGQRHADRASRFDREPKPFDRLMGFAGAMFSTMKDWNDALLAELPGVRERVAEVSLPDNIGGLNIRMDADQIECLGRLGGEVARQLLRRFAVPDQHGQARGWREHRWVRLNVLGECLRQSVAGLGRSAQYARHALPLREQIRHAAEEAPLAGSGQRPLLPAEAAMLERMLDALLQIERTLAPGPIKPPFQAEPRPELRVRPPM